MPERLTLLNRAPTFPTYARIFRAQSMRGRSVPRAGAPWGFESRPAWGWTGGAVAADFFPSRTRPTSSFVADSVSPDRGLLAEALGGVGAGFLAGATGGLTDGVTGGVTGAGASFLLGAAGASPAASRIRFSVLPGSARGSAASGGST